ncbi:MAG: MotA/TolQ/ExbB proton channel family protein [Immundisolibacteraceae bacterium]|nr:MotA/TolQ/ExbB proton channel family protein [Immundisolibacteraceae bacterium]
MIELIKSGGWLMLPILLCSVVALAIVIERFWALQAQKINPDFLLGRIRRWHDQQQLNSDRIRALHDHSPLGRVLAAGLSNLDTSRELMKESIEETGRHVVLELERFLNTLGTIASITPLMGLLGTVIGMIKVFAVITEQGVGDPTVLSGGISEALITTAAGLTVAIPSVAFHRYFRGRVNELVLEMEQEAIRMVEVIHGERSDNQG